MKEEVEEETDPRKIELLNWVRAAFDPLSWDHSNHEWVTLFLQGQGQSLLPLLQPHTGPESREAVAAHGWDGVSISKGNGGFHKRQTFLLCGECVLMP